MGEKSTECRIDERYISSVDIWGVVLWECNMLKRSDSVAIASSGFISTVCIIKITKQSIRPENCSLENDKTCTKDSAMNLRWSLNYWLSTCWVSWMVMRILLITLIHLVMADKPHFSPRTTQLINSLYECDLSVLILFVIILRIISSSFSLQL